MDGDLLLKKKIFASHIVFNYKWSFNNLVDLLSVRFLFMGYNYMQMRYCSLKC